MCPNSRWPPKLLRNLVFDHNFQITLRGKGNFTKPVDRYVCLVKYLPESMGNDSSATCSGGRDHQGSFKGIVQGHFKDKGNLTKNKFVSGIIGKVIYLRV